MALIEVDWLPALCRPQASRPRAPRSRKSGCQWGLLRVRSRIGARIGRLGNFWLDAGRFDIGR
eukprot:11195950-Alexandrium_andersonii.AAC.1